MLCALVLVLAAAPSGTTVTPFRTEVTPRVDPVFGDIASLRQAVDRFLELQTEMEQVRSEFSTAVHSTLATLMPSPNGTTPHSCPAGALPQYERAMAAGGRYLSLGRQLEARFREIRRSEELGDGAGLTPDYRVKMKKARDLYQDLLRDYREMRVAFYDQLGAEMRHASCPLPTTVTPKAHPGQNDPTTGPPRAPDPSDPAAWALEDTSAAPPAKLTAPAPRATRPPTGSGASPAIWITIDNSRCAQASQLSLDGTALGAVASHRKVTVRTRAGPHDVCVLPTSDKRACGDTGTLRRAYLYEGWTLVVRCGG
jgi:hypothetical protein